jgi:hypothetical protein
MKNVRNAFFITAYLDLLEQGGAMMTLPCANNTTPPTVFITMLHSILRQF